MTAIARAAVLGDSKVVRVRTAINSCERLFLGAMVALSIGALIPFGRVGGAMSYDVERGDSAVMAPWLLFYGVIGLFAALNRRPALRALRDGRRLLPIIALVFASALWSPDPAQSFKLALHVGGSAYLGCYIASRYGLRDAAKLVATALSISVLACFALVVLAPMQAIEHGAHLGAMRGVFATKNVFGRGAALALLFASALMPVRTHGKVLRLAALVVDGFGAIASASATSIFATLFAGASVPAWRTLRTPVVKAMALSTMVALTAIAAMTVSSVDVLPAVMRLAGRDLTLTGRTEMWQRVLENIGREPVLGHGYAAFWTTSAAETIARSIGWEAPHAHNGLLETALDTGLVGVALLVLVFRRALLDAQWFARANVGRFGALPLSFLAFFAVYNLTEAAAVRHDNVLWVLLSLFSTGLCRARREARAVAAQHARHASIELDGSDLQQAGA